MARLPRDKTRKLKTLKGNLRQAGRTVEEFESSSMTEITGNPQMIRPASVIRPFRIVNITMMLALCGLLVAGVLTSDATGKRSWLMDSPITWGILGSCLCVWGSVLLAYRREWATDTWGRRWARRWTWWIPAAWRRKHRRYSRSHTYRCYLIVGPAIMIAVGIATVFASFVTLTR
jgi:hypothetical protein